MWKQNFEKREISSRRISLGEGPGKKGGRKGGRDERGRMRTPSRRSEDIADANKRGIPDAIPGAVNYRNNPAVNSYPRFITALDPLKLNS